MSNKPIKLLDTVTLVEDMPEHNLKRGEVGTVVEILAPDVFEVEFSNEDGETYAELPLRAHQLVGTGPEGGIRRAECFISYSSQDKEFANFVRSELSRLGVNAFMASTSIQPGQHWSPEVMNSLRSSNWVILLASRTASSSAFVNQEIGGALLASKKLVPIVWDMSPDELPGWARGIQAIDLRGSTVLGLQQQVGTIAHRINQEKTKGLLILGAVLFGFFALSGDD